VQIEEYLLFVYDHANANCDFLRRLQDPPVRRETANT